MSRAASDREEAPQRPIDRVLSSRQFWDLMERWHVPDATALELIEFPGKLGKDGKRRRFRFTTHQQRIASYLPEIDAALASAGKDQAWLHRKIQRSPFSRRTPIEHIVAHRDGRHGGRVAGPHPRGDASGSDQASGSP